MSPVAQARTSAAPLAWPAPAETVDRRLGLFLSAGGDSRIWPDPVTARTRYGTLARPAPDELQFSSTTASTIGMAGYVSAGRALDALLGATGNPIAPDEWFADIRDRIAALTGAHGRQVVLAASGTDAELLAVLLVQTLSGRPLTNIVVAPEETGSGVGLAARGCHFLASTALGAGVTAGARIAGAEHIDIAVIDIAIRDRNGVPREPSQVDNDAHRAVVRALRAGRDVLLHVLDTSKTGLAGVSRRMATYLAALAPGRVHVLVDACQLRCPLAQVGADVAAGFIVAVTGSKFAGGPPFSGALLLPGAFADEVARRGGLPAGVAGYSALNDWPDGLRAGLANVLVASSNIGLGLRWHAALAGLEALGADDTLHDRIITHFRSAVLARAADLGSLQPLDDPQCDRRCGSIVALVPTSPAGAPEVSENVARLHVALRAEPPLPICHVGQPVRIGARTALRLAASADDLASVGARMATGASLEAAFAPLAGRLDALFAKWAAIRDRAWSAS